MQRVSALLPSWDRSRNSAGSSGKTSLDKVRGWADRIPSSGNRLSTASSKTGRELYAPTTLDRECERAARILISFCRDGYLVTDDRPSSPTTTASGTSTRKVLKKIPPRVIQNAVGLAVFTSMRSGLWSSGSGGSGILLARKTDGTWSPPSGLTLQTASLGFVLGVDICDCVIVINSFTTLETFGRAALTLGTDVQMTSGPVVSLGLLENEFKWADLSDTVFTYVKSKGLSTDTKMDGTVLNERADENERFYGCSFSVPKILAGDVNQSLPQLRPLHEVLKFAEGRNDYDANLVEQLANQPTPGDASIDPSHSGAPSPIFGIPDPEDPDPYGVLALGLAGSEIREAGTRLRPDSSQFDFCPSPASPAFPKYNRQSMDTYLTRSNRGSYMSNKTERSHVTEAGTQTDVNTAATTPSPGQSEAGYQPSIEESPEEEEEVKQPEEVDYTQIDISAIRKLTAFPDLDEDLPTETNDDKALDIEIEQTASPKTISESEPELDADDEDDDFDQNESEISDDLSDDDDEFEDAEEPIVYEVATVQPPRMLASQVVQMKGAVVNIPRRVPPPLPMRSPARMSRTSKSEFGDVSMISSPLRNEFEIPLQADDVSTPKAGESFETSARDSMDEAAVPVTEEKTDATDAEETVDYFTQPVVASEAQKPTTTEISHALEAEEKKQAIEAKSTNNTVSGETTA
ncbi:hypothetical protein PFICI_05634 [Pestalotiopsis fici W106-1]|uniref:Ysc84 actin-binding domain-containing protein n=1 Tax=Pestalotiopsis fici (strain W106-1 / CGMCC3.15140) TaxID=1229662 RepID=W3XCF4_PESFW|nr:uncharacterized protein PFICI_05634 [Pestalotiopsis fici W106-1]ETS83758.1 hypothetical protein PFICI_05634 [Pestalotiopsis fici W106-1]